jgi:NAD(P)-dependent dehydrogenase (short-subunit alcohol dehydrogenase family)
MVSAKKNAQVVLVTGASSGIGKAIAKRLHKDGLTVIAAARSIDKMQDLKTLGARPMTLDVTDEDSVTGVMADITASFGGVDVLVNNAGFGVYGAVEDVTLEKVRYQFEVNLFGLGRLTQLILPAMRAKRSGKIINISSMGGKVYTPLGAWYHASKCALEGWSDCLRLEAAPFGIDVVIIEPGATESGFAGDGVRSLLEASGNGAYSQLAKNVAKALSGPGSKPELISDLVAAAIAARRPKTRYVAGKYAKPMMFMRGLLSDRMFDKLILKAMG